MFCETIIECQPLMCTNNNTFIMAKPVSQPHA